MLDGDYKITLGKLREVSLLSRLKQAEVCETNLRRDSEMLESQLKQTKQDLAERNAFIQNFNKRFTFQGFGNSNRNLQ